ncbi:hypothetical protein DFS34DRAFT_407097 [Phlyctochytrium arcticum]|nr:hypothetical protein DFS34DRAFT_407097 [Phlyctochytrium arcticum]
MAEFPAFKYAREQYIVVYIHLFLWALCWTLAYVYRNNGRVNNASSVNNVNNTPVVKDELPAPATATTTTTTTAASLKSLHLVPGAAENAERIARMTLLQALVCSIISGVYGPTRSTSGLLWFFMCLSVVHVLAVAFVRHRAVPLAFGALSFVIVIIIAGLGFR